MNENDLIRRGDILDLIVEVLDDTNRKHVTASYRRVWNECANRLTGAIMAMPASVPLSDEKLP